MNWLKGASASTQARDEVLIFRNVPQEQSVYVLPMRWKQASFQRQSSERWRKVMRIVLKALAIGAVAALAQISAPVATTAVAQGYSNMTCGQLWYARNRIYADAGFCFKTERARRVFGAGCFPPYGRLSGWAREEVNRIQSWEARNGC